MKPATNNKKLQQYLEEINEVSERYQYALTAVLDFSRKGIMPKLVVNEVVPEKKVRKKKNESK